MVLTKTIKVLVAILVVMLPVGLFLMLGGNPWKQYLWTTNVFLALEAFVTFIFLINAAEQKSVVLAAAGILVLAFVIELTGLRTGLPFGQYSYSKTLEPSLFGVPVAISFSWFSVVVNSYFTARFLVEESKIFSRLLLASLLILSIDILLEPFASSFNGYWVWISGRVPLQNYASWFVIGFIFSFLLERFVIWNRNIFLNINFITIPAVVLAINVLQFTIVNVFAGFYIPTIAGLVITCSCVLLSLKARKNEE